MNGKVKTYYSDNSLLSSTYFRKGKKNGKCKIYRRNGKLWTVMKYKDDMLHGTQIFYKNSKVTGKKYISEKRYYKRDFLCRYIKFDELGNTIYQCETNLLI